ncbi:hydrogenase maturation protease [Pseudarthrobacter sp. P1]|uniref:hydrogenase maturation protease n=1 Tax=Pseudarthrobacter sp. P1 TaxID=3418418 RepID=UPI003CE9BB22
MSGTHPGTPMAVGTTRPRQPAGRGPAPGPVSAPARILVAGVGNIFLGDDGFGPEVARRIAVGTGVAGTGAGGGAEPGADGDLGRRGVRVVDYGIRGIHLAYDLLAGVDALILVDAVPAAPLDTTSSGTGNRPGDVRVFQVSAQDLSGGSTGGGLPPLDPHGMDPLTVLARLQTLGGELPLTFVVGCVPETTAEGIGLSAAVAGAVPEAIETIMALVAEHGPGARRDEPCV